MTIELVGWFWITSTASREVGPRTSRNQISRRPAAAPVIVTIPTPGFAFVANHVSPIPLPCRYKASADTQVLDASSLIETTEPNVVSTFEVITTRRLPGIVGVTGNVAVTLFGVKTSRSCTTLIGPPIGRSPPS